MIKLYRNEFQIFPKGKNINIRYIPISSIVHISIKEKNNSYSVNIETRKTEQKNTVEHIYF